MHCGKQFAVDVGMGTKNRLQFGTLFASHL